MTLLPAEQLSGLHLLRSTRRFTARQTGWPFQLLRYYASSRSWTEKDIALLVKSKEEGKSWTDIFAQFPHRTTHAVRMRYYKTDEPLKASKQAWTEEDNARLAQLREDKIPWEEVTKSFPGRNLHAIQMHYYQYMVNPIKSSQIPCTKEDYALMAELKAKGHSWDDIAAEFPGRSKSALMTRYSRNFPSGSKVKFSEEESALLLESRNSGVSWAETQAAFPGRSLSSLMTRYSRYTNPQTINRKKVVGWTKEEDLRLVELRMAGNWWRDIAAKMPGRSYKGA